MNASSAVNSLLSTQNVVKNSNSFQTNNVSKTKELTETNSFLSILNLLDVNADGKIDTQELKFGAGFMINSLIQAKDQNSDQALSAEEAGVAPGTVSQLDTNSDQNLGAGEMITAADKIIDGLVPVLDTNGDGALSREELAILELLFAGNSSIASAGEKGTGSGQEVAGAYQPAVSGTGTSSELQKNISVQA